MTLMFCFQKPKIMTNILFFKAYNFDINILFNEFNDNEPLIDFGFMLSSNT